MRGDAVETFCRLHNGILTRMHDDIAKFSQDQMQQLDKCGVTFGNYIPHITAWYINLPSESKTPLLQDIAISLANETTDLNCYAKSVALVELGRNGNAINILEQYPLKAPASDFESHTEL